MKNARHPEGMTSALEQRQYNPPSDLFPELLPPVVPASWPTIGTRADEALGEILNGPQNQADYWHSWRLAAYVKDLEYRGWRFIKRDITKPGCRRPIAEYQIDLGDPATAAALESRRAKVLA
jgi:hypothetical protein